MAAKKKKPVDLTTAILVEIRDDIRAVRVEVRGVGERLDRLIDRVDALDRRLTALEKRVDSLDVLLVSIWNTLKSIDAKTVEHHLYLELEGRVADLERKVS